MIELIVSEAFPIGRLGTAVMLKVPPMPPWAVGMHLVQVISIDGQCRAAQAHVEFARTGDGEVMALRFASLTPEQLPRGTRILLVGDQPAESRSNWPHPWQAVVEGAPLVRELRREMCEAHCLFDRNLDAIAKRADSDDVLFSIDGGLGGYALVHLTYRIETQAIWPHTALFGSLDEFFLAHEQSDN